MMVKAFLAKAHPFSQAASNATRNMAAMALPGGREAAQEGQEDVWMELIAVQAASGYAFRQRHIREDLLCGNRSFSRAARNTAAAMLTR